MIKRYIGGEGAFFTTFKATGGSGVVGVSGKQPGKIKAYSLEAGQSIICSRGAFLCAEDSVEFDLELSRSVGFAFFGGEGVVLQKATGPGQLLLHVPGDIIEYQLDVGEKLDVATSHLAAFDAGMSYKIRRSGNIFTMLFGGEGMFLSEIEGPGKVIVQSLPTFTKRKKDKKDD